MRVKLRVYLDRSTDILVRTLKEKWGGGGEVFYVMISLSVWIRAFKLK